MKPFPPNLIWLCGSFCLLGLMSCQPDENLLDGLHTKMSFPDATMGSHLKLDLTQHRQEQAVVVCPEGETLYGIDVSKWQGDINWPEVASAGVEYAFIRVSDGLDYFDQKFAQNWEGARANGILRGSYQFFRSDEDPVAQANLLLNTMGPLEPGDLPPVIDVESTDGQTPETIATNVGIWIDTVESALGVKPIIYTGRYFWEDNVQSDAFSENPLWVPNWGVSCPNIPSQWSGWAFWQTSDNGTVPGISGAVDENLFNGDLDALYEFTVGDPVCGDAYCTGNEDNDSCPEDCPICENIPANGRIIDDDDLCFLAGGAAQYIRFEDDAGYGGSLKWSKTWITEETENFGQWFLNFDVAGEYLIEVYTDAAYAQWTEAIYEIAHGDDIEAVIIDQTAVDGWQEIGTFEFLTSTANGSQWLLIEDRVEEEDQSGLQFVLDAIRITRVAHHDGGTADQDGGISDADGGAHAFDGGTVPENRSDGGSNGENDEDRDEQGDDDESDEGPEGIECACLTVGLKTPLMGMWALVLIAVIGRRRRH